MSLTEHPEATTQFFDPDDRDGWLGWRKLGIGASDVAAIFGMSPYASPMSVYMDKLGLTGPDDDNDYMEYGRRAEPMITGYLEDRTGLFVVDQQACVTHPVWSHHRATLDGRVCEHPDGEPLGDAEYKTAERGTEKDYERAIPDAYAIQIQWQLHVDQKDHAWLGVMHGRVFRYYEVERDDRAISMLVERVDQFWNDHVLAMVPPPSDAHKATASALAAAYPEPVEGEAVPIDNVQWALDLRADAAERAAAAKFDKAKAENAIKAAIGDAEVGTVEGTPAVTWKQQTRAEVVQKASTFRVLRTVGGKK